VSGPVTFERCKGSREAVGELLDDVGACRGGIRTAVAAVVIAVIRIRAPHRRVR